MCINLHVELAKPTFIGLFLVTYSRFTKGYWGLYSHDDKGLSDVTVWLRSKKKHQEHEPGSNEKTSNIYKHHTDMINTISSFRRRPRGYNCWNYNSYTIEHLTIQPLTLTFQNTCVLNLQVATRVLSFIIHCGGANVLLFKLLRKCSFFGVYSIVVYNQNVIITH